MPRRQAVSACCLAVLLLATSVAGQDPGLAGLSTAERLAQVRADIEAYSRDATKVEAANDTQLTLMRRLEQVLAQLQKAEQESPDGTAPPPPARTAAVPPTGTVTVAQLDRLNDELDRARAAVRDAEQAVALAERGEARIAEETAGKGSEAGARDAETPRTGRLRAEIAAARQRLAVLETEDLRRTLAALRQVESVIAAEIDDASGRLVARGDELATILSELEHLEIKLRQERDAGAAAEESANQRFVEVQSRVDAVALPDAELAAELRARQLELRLARRRVAAADDSLNRIPGRREVWRRRWAVLAGNTSRDEMRRWLPQMDTHIGELEYVHRQHSLQRAQTERELEELRADRQSSSAWRTRQVRALTGMLELQSNQLNDLASDLSRERRLRSELENLVGERTTAERVGEFLDAMSRVWNHQILAYDDHPLTVGKLAIAVALLVIGFLVSGRVSHTLAVRAFARLGMSEAASATFEILARYTILLLVALVALRIANIPLTIFTLLGGAIAIGVGFGSQNIVNNFISGLIILAERPMKIGDLVEVDGTLGTVESIGARSTRIRTPGNAHIVVPNGSFLEKNLVNWMLSDKLIRTELVVGVAYGSPVRRVEELLYDAVRQHPKILGTPAPTILFADFGDNALLFEVLFWFSMTSNLERRIILSDLRFAIDEAFRAAAITIAYPQRDVHLDTLKPLEVRLLEDQPDLAP